MVAMPIVWDERCRLHEPGAEIWVGLATPGTEVPARADALLAALGDTVPAEPHDDEVLLQVHDRELVAFLESAWESWRAAGLPEDPGQGRVVPYVFAHEGIRAREGAGRGVGAPRLLRLRHDDADRPRDVGGRARQPSTPRSPPSISSTGGAPHAYALLPPAGTPRLPRRLRRLVLPEQRRGRGRGAAPSRGAVSACSTSTRTTATGRRRSSGTGTTSASRRSTSIRRTAGSRTSSASRTSRPDSNLNVPLAPGNRRRRLARGRAPGGGVARGRGARRLPRRRRGRERSREPAARDARPDSARPAASSARSACRRCSSRRAATTSRRSDRSCSSS